MPAPDAEYVTAYLNNHDDTNPGLSWTDEAIAAALAAETEAQSRVCTIAPEWLTEEGAYPADLAEALCRRVAHNLALRALPLGVQTTLTDGAVAATRVGGSDAEVRRLEAPYRRLVLG